MKITPINQINIYSNQAKKNNINKNQKTTIQGDSLEISQTARETSKYNAELKKLPQIREEKIQTLKESIKKGTYQPSAEKIAEEMINERRLDELV
ncbi:flagellar biosynthesis anti-sigma factor FlgM [Desulfofalx alkaliphila]|uniref:flagellar biosynthesis anti-sigma factor FlgM n=1 Tax=Desulfofalx alkaliphila TaxID=105483 RepID=UPI00068C83BB|nr:flagellar biosynthesis anti-sigma factor FlgM [Desulfofalx alkaliphila]